MNASRPLAVLLFMAILVAAAAWYSPPQQQTALVAVMLPGEVYSLLSQQGEAEADTTGHPRSVAQVIEGLARK